MSLRDQLLALFDEEDEHVHRLPLQPDGTPLVPQLVGLHIEFEIAEAECDGERLRHGYPARRGA